MAKHREQEYCPNCNQPLKAVHRDMGKNFVGDTFIRYELCNCEKKQEEKSVGIFMQPQESKPIVNEVFADNGEHSHWELIDPRNGKILWVGDEPTPPVSGEPGGLQDEIWEEVGEYLFKCWGQNDTRLITENLKKDYSISSKQ